MSLRVLLSYKNYKKLTLQYFDKYTLLTDLLKLRKHRKSALSGKLFHTELNHSCEPVTQPVEGVWLCLEHDGICTGSVFRQFSHQQI